MGTRAVVLVKNKNNKKIIELYSQFDGYPKGLGKDILDFINSKEMVDGCTQPETQFNGINCFAAQLVAHFKDGAGGFYLEVPTLDLSDKTIYSKLYNAEYCYEIDADLNVKCWDTYTGKELDLTKEINNDN